MLTSISSVMKKNSPLKFKKDLDISLVIKNIIYMVNFLGDERFKNEKTSKKSKADFFNIKNEHSQMTKSETLNLYQIFFKISIKIDKLEI